MPTIAAVADKFNKPVKNLLGQMTSVYPDRKWTPDSEVPQEFLDKIQQHGSEYDGTQTPSEQLPAGELTLAESSNIILTEDGFEYGVITTLQEIELSVMISEGRLAGVELANAYQQGKEEALSAYFDAEYNRSKAALDKLGKRAKQIAGAANNRQQQRGKLAAKTANIKAQIAALPKII